MMMEDILRLISNLRCEVGSYLSSSHLYNTFKSSYTNLTKFPDRIFLCANPKVFAL